MINNKSIKFFFIIVCILQIFYIFHFRSGFKLEVLRNPFNINSGVEYALPQESIEAKNLVKKFNLVNFNLSENFKKNSYLYQRTIEFNYPIRIQDKSKYIFSKL